MPDIQQDVHLVRKRKDHIVIRRKMTTCDSRDYAFQVIRVQDSGSIFNIFRLEQLNFTSLVRGITPIYPTSVTRDGMW